MSSPTELPQGARVGVFTLGLYRSPHLRSLLGAERLVLWPRNSHAGTLDFIVGWGRKPNTVTAQRYSKRHGLPFVRLEDGFLRSVGLGVSGAPALSVVLDDRGVYYDSTRPSRLELLLASPSPGGPLDDPELIDRAGRCLRRIVEARLSKYNNSPVEAPQLPPSRGRKRVLVVDQTRGDMSVRLGQVAAGGFDAMLEAAIAENPGAQILVKTHPDVAAGKRRGYLTRLRDQRIELISAPMNPMALMELVDRVYVVTSQLGFEAVMLGKPVTCFGAPFYAGWGLTDDRVAIARRGIARSKEQVFAAAYLLSARYVDPDTGERAELERVIEHLDLQRRLFAHNAGRLFCFGFSGWKRNYIRHYLRCPNNEVVFVRTSHQAKRRGFDPESKIVVWGARGEDEARELSGEFGVPTWRMEDGFLRSVGLGSDLTAPASLVVDRRGVYYDPRTASDLEAILAETQFSPGEVERAQTLRRAIVDNAVSKYNIDGGDSVRGNAAPGQRVLLVPGQVEDDMSVLLGSPKVRTNTELLRAVRRARPDAYVIYKPHPDVVSGNRQGAVHADDVAALCDEMVVDAGIGRCLAVADEVHTMTSLVGFEALLREQQVVVYGQPFYSGWGLTEDRVPPARRGRKLTLDELVAGVLIRYPRYLNNDSGEFTRPEYVVSALIRGRSAAGEVSLKRSWARRQTTHIGNALRAVARLKR